MAFGSDAPMLINPVDYARLVNSRLSLGVIHTSPCGAHMAGGRLNASSIIVALTTDVTEADVSIENN